jgi:hypothetical protein
MSPAVLRNGALKSYLVFDLAIMGNLLQPMEQDEHARAVHVMAHECAHVEITDAYDRCFPETLLRKQATTRAEQIAGGGWHTWQEYAATKRAAPFGRDPTQDYEGVFLTALAGITDDVQQRIDAYRMSHDVERLYHEPVPLIERFLELTAYHVGNLAGRGISLEDTESYAVQVASHPLAAHLITFAKRCEDVEALYGHWPDHTALASVGSMRDDIAAALGLILTELPNGRLYLRVP